MVNLKSLVYFVPILCILKIQKGPGVVAYSLVPAFGRLRYMNIYDLEASLVYIVSSKVHSKPS